MLEIKTTNRHNRPKMAGFWKGRTMNKNERERIQSLLDQLETILPQVSELRRILAENHVSAPPQRQQSYVQLAIALLEEIGRPTPITILLEQIRERRNDPTITRGAVETSLLRHLNVKGDSTDVVKLAPGTYALRQHLGHAF